jgi:hydroxymethylpyrimidine/phosphomethylpyrimidine kinase
VKTALTIAASDSGGSCGLQADLRTFAALGLFGTSTVTSVTAQNTQSMGETFDLDTGLVMEQARMVLEDLQPAAIKIGMIGRAENYTGLARLFSGLGAGPVVLDPDITCYRGCPWVLARKAVDTMIEDMLPRTEILAASIPDAEVMLQGEIRSVSAMEDASRALKARGPGLVVMKGGHLEGDPVDVLFDGDNLHHLKSRRIHTPDDNGSGCVFSSAIASFRALGKPPFEAVQEARSYMQGALFHTVRPGRGKGTIDHFYRMSSAKNQFYGPGPTADHLQDHVQRETSDEIK